MRKNILVYIAASASSHSSARCSKPTAAAGWSEKGVRLAQKIHVDPCIPVGVQACSYKRMELAQLLGQLGIFLTWSGSDTRCAPSAARPTTLPKRLARSPPFASRGPVT